MIPSKDDGRKQVKLAAIGSAPTTRKKLPQGSVHAKPKENAYAALQSMCIIVIMKMVSSRRQL